MKVFKEDVELDFQAVLSKIRVMPSKAIFSSPQFIDSINLTFGGCVYPIWACDLYFIHFIPSGT